MTITYFKGVGFSTDLMWLLQLNKAQTQTLSPSP